MIGPYHQAACGKPSRTWAHGPRDQTAGTPTKKHGVECMQLSKPALFVILGDMFLSLAAAAVLEGGGGGAVNCTGAVPAWSHGCCSLLQAENEL
jgi:hypothetical protein